MIIDMIRHKKIVPASEALSRVRDNDVVAVSGFNLASTPDYLLKELYDLYVKTGHPSKLFIVSDTLPGSPGKGLDRIAKDMLERKDYDFIRGVLLPFLGWTPNMQELVKDNIVEGYTWSIGIMAYWFREVGSGRPGVISRVGLATFLDPEYDAGALNDLAKEKRTAKIDYVKLGGKIYLFYHAPKPNVALIRGTTADEIGNLTLEGEALIGTVLNIAQAAKARPNTGMVIAQVMRLAKFGSLNPKCVQVPGPIIDYIVTVKNTEYHKQTANIVYDPRISGEIIPPLDPSLYEKPPLDARKVIARRILLQFVKIIRNEHRPIIINLGIGIPSLATSVAIEEEISDLLATTIESGPWGGKALAGEDFGASIGPYAIIPMPDQFSVYEGGILDAAGLGFLQIDRHGNVNPSVLPGRMTGPGGFPVIATGSPRLYFAGLFTAGKQDIRVLDGKLDIHADGEIVKFVDHVYKILCSGINLLRKKEVLFITERAVFRLSSEGLILEEIAPGVDIEKDIINKMEFKPVIHGEPKLMDERLFRNRRMNLLHEIIEIMGK
ncbi:MAG: acyl CoA:acetate/3-ketoacid CoA transferase [Desulfurococcales archaeon]|nr:acyl CoA:acetate/3-ketoacid CoA transferase [Desulfurococcales archaeon]